MSKACWSKVVLIALLAAAGPLASSAAAQEVSFTGKSVRMIVGASAGGVTDAGARVVARFLGKYLPGSPNIVVQNMPGANGIAATNYFYQQVAPDGLTSLAGSSSQVTPDVVRGNPAVRYDLRKVVMFGGIQYSGTILVASKPAIERLKSGSGAPVVMAEVGGVRTGGMTALWGAECLGWKLHRVTGYEDNQQVMLALQRGEADMMNTTGLGFIEPLMKEPDKFGIILQTGVVRDGRLVRRQQFPNVPLASELLEGKLDNPGRRAFEAWVEMIKLGKYFSLPANTPAPYVAAYKKAFIDMQADPEFKQQAESTIEPGYVMMSAEEAVDVIERLAAIPDDDLKEIDRLRDKYASGASEGGPKKQKQ